jgi:glucose-1-phosphate cytidylyltransferase
MKVAILAGGKGTRLAEETSVRPKPMVEIGGEPILSHIMRIYAHHGFDEFVVALGYKGEVIKRYFADYAALSGNLTFKLNQSMSPIRAAEGVPDWTVDLVETGYETMTGGRVKRLKPWLGDGTFLLTWGDGLSDVNINTLIDFHKSHGKLATVTAVRPQARYGHMLFEGNQVVSFEEKPQTAEGWINGAFFVLEPQVLDYIDDDSVMFEHAPMENLAKDGQLMAYFHTGFWSAMDTLRDKRVLENLWDSGERPWAVWE